MVPSNPNNQNLFGAFSSIAGATKPYAISGWSLGPNKSTSQPNSQQSVSDFMNMIRGTPSSSKDMFKKAPVYEDYQGAIMRDFAEASRVNQANWQQNKEATDRVLKENLNTANQLRNYQNPFFKQAEEAQKALVTQTQADRANFDKQAQQAQQKLQEQTNQAMGAYAQALSAVDEGRDRIATEMAEGMRKNYEQQRVEGLGALSAQGISPDQIAEVERQNKWDMERSIGANISQMQFQGAQIKAGIQQAKANTLASLAQSTANFTSNLMGMGMDQAKAVQNAVKLGYDTAMYRAQDYAERQDTAAKLETAGYNNWAEGVRNNPIMGVSILPSLLNIASAAQLTGGSEAERAREEKARSEYMSAQSRLMGLGARSSGNFDITQLIQGGMSVPGISAESAAWIRQNGIPRIKVIGDLGGAGQSGYAPGTAPQGLQAQITSDESYGRGGFKPATSGITPRKVK